MSAHVAGVLNDSDDDLIGGGSGLLDNDDVLGSSWNSDTPSSTSESLSWISWWCSHHGHEYFCEVPEDFIEDDFNMTGLPALVQHYREALELILDLDPEDDAALNQSAAEQSSIEASAELLYGLVHQRYILSRIGLAAMAEKYEACHFGVCPRILCERTAVLPVGLSDTPRDEPVKLYCPTCLDVYTPPNSRFQNVDGAFFGTTFPHLFFLTFPDLIKPVACTPYEPRIYGFRVSTKARTGPKMAFLRHYIGQLPEGSEIDSDEEEDDDEGRDGAASVDGIHAMTTAPAGAGVVPAAGAGASSRRQDTALANMHAEAQPGELGTGAQEDVDVRGARNGDAIIGGSRVAGRDSVKEELDQIDVDMTTSRGTLPS